MYQALQLPFDSGLLETAAQLVTVVATVVLLMMLVALGSFAYKSLRGDGIRWPDEAESDEETVSKGDGDDDWKYY